MKIQSAATPTTTTPSRPYVPPHRRKSATSSSKSISKSIASTPITTTATATATLSINTSTTKAIASSGGSSSKENDDGGGTSTERRKNRKSTRFEDEDNEDVQCLCDNLERIVCINMRDRLDKYRAVQAQARHVGESFGYKMERFEAVNGVELCVRVEEEEKQLPPHHLVCGSKSTGYIFDGAVYDNVPVVQIHWDVTKNAQYSSRLRAMINRGGSLQKTMTCGEVGCAASHVRCWRELAGLPPRISSTINAITFGTDEGDSDCNTTKKEFGRSLDEHDFHCNNNNDDDTNWLILEDDCAFASSRGKSRFARAFAQAWKQLPTHWDILYLGFSSRGERTYMNNNALDHHHTNEDVSSTPMPSCNSSCSSSSSNNSCNHSPYESHINLHQWQYKSPLRVHLYRPEYGFHTHAYVIRKRAARHLLSKLPVVGPIDVWLADHEWFNLQVYCAIISGEGWQLEDGTFEGNNLVSQLKGKFTSDVEQSCLR